MQLHELKRKTKNTTSTQVGRGGKRGKTSGRGHKGQKARAGHSIRPEARDMIKRIPKLRGHGKNRARTVNSGRKPIVALDVSVLEKHVESGAKVTPQYLVEKKIVEAKGGKIPSVKILGQGDVSKKITVEGCLVSATAKEKIEKAGGSVV